LIAATVNRTYTWFVRRAVKRAGFVNPIFWVFQFSAEPVISNLEPELVVYECAEEWYHYETRPQIRQYIKETDQEMCRRADVVFVPSQALFESKKAHNEQTFLVPWGVDTELYGRTSDPNTPIPRDIQHLNHPIVGMFGMLDGRRLHIELLNQLATRHPDWNIVLVGRCMPNLDRGPLKELPNVHWPGFKDVAELPGYCKAYDVCIIPYIINEFTSSIMPLKLVEYLATGKPVVTTALPAADDFRDLIHVADTIEEFERCVIASLTHDNEEDRRLRLERSKEFSWDLLAECKMQIAADQLTRQPAEAAL
jgi:glycosyltransferase involved in cell wall biosynthesis